MDCIVVSEERLASLSEFLNTKVTAESTNKYYRGNVVTEMVCEVRSVE